MSDLVYEKYYTYTGVKVFDDGNEFLIKCRGVSSTGKIRKVNVRLKDIDLDLKWFGLVHAKRLANKELKQMERQIADYDAESNDLNCKISSGARSMAIQGWMQSESDQQPIQ